MQRLEKTIGEGPIAYMQKALKYMDVKLVDLMSNKLLNWSVGLIICSCLFLIIVIIFLSVALAKNKLTKNECEDALCHRDVGQINKFMSIALSMSIIAVLFLFIGLVCVSVKIYKTTGTY